MKSELIGKTVQEAMALYPKRTYVLVKDGVRQTVKCFGDIPLKVENGIVVDVLTSKD